MTETTEVKKKGAGLAIAGFILGILALIFCWCPILNWILAILAIIFCVLGIFLNRLKGLAIAGLICAVATICIWTLAIHTVSKSVKSDFEKNYQELVDQLDEELEGEEFNL